MKILKISAFKEFKGSYKSPKLNLNVPDGFWMNVSANRGVTNGASEVTISQFIMASNQNLIEVIGLNSKLKIKKLISLVEGCDSKRAEQVLKLLK